MNVSRDTHGSMRPRRDASSRLARLLDRAVVVARAGQCLVFAGRLVVAVTLAILTIALACSFGLRLPFPTGPIAVAVAIGIAAWLGSRRWTWPDRLATAMALERAHPRIGERISRAVEFIGTPDADAGPQADLSAMDLIGEALEEAATAFEALAQDRSGKRHAVRGTLLPLRWPLAGLAAAVAVAIALFVAPGRLVPPVVEAFFTPLPTEPIGPPAGPEPSAVLPKSAVAAAARLAEAAATEERLAVALLARFARLPGGSREELTQAEQDWLDETAVLQAAIADDVGRDLESVVEAVQPHDPRLASELAVRGLVRECTAKLVWAAERIRGNQLAAASGLITSQVRPILAALAECGVVPSGKTRPAFDRAELVQRRIVSAIEADGDRLPGATTEAGPISEGDTVDLAPADQTGRAPPPKAVATVLEDRTGPVAGSSTGTGGGTAGDAGLIAGDAGLMAGDAGGPGSGGVVRTDSDGRLPAWVRAREERPVETLTGDGFSVPPRYRAAVDDYYRRLWAAESPAPPKRIEHEQPEKEAAP